MNRIPRLFYWLAFVILFCSGRAHAQPETKQEPVAESAPSEESVVDEIKSGFRARINVVGFGLVQQPIDSALNPNNALGIVDYQTELDLRPDFNLKFRRLELALSPRLEGRWQKWNEGFRKGSEGSAEIFVQYWLARYRIIDPLFVSYGRENLQWGPSYLLSVSNPFNSANGKNNPELEVPGLGYGRLVWVPNSEWTASFIANITTGRLNISDFKRAYALKLDYIGTGKYFTLIPSYREDGTSRVGFYGGWSASDAALLYTEGQILSQGKNPRILVGGSYTLELGPTLGLEYFRKADGCDREPIILCFTPTSGGANSIIRPGQEQDFIRKNYLMLQYLQSRIRNVFNVTVRWVRNLDDNSNRFNGIFEYELGNHTQIFMVNNVLEGSRKAEFRSAVGFSVMLGVSYTF